MSTTRYERAMSISEADFIRLLPFAVAPCRPDIGKGCAEIHEGDRRARVTFRPQQAHRIGQLCLPVLAVEIEFEGYDADQARHFMAAFDRGFQRGGG